MLSKSQNSILPYQERMLLKVLKQLEGISKIEAYDLLTAMETILHGISSPIRFEDAKRIIMDPHNNENITAIGDQGFCYREDRCQFFSVYKFTSLYPTFLSGTNTYFVAPDDCNLIAFNNRNIETFFYNTSLRETIIAFLKKNSVTKRNPKTRKLLLLELLDTIDSG